MLERDLQIVRIVLGLNLLLMNNFSVKKPMVVIKGIKSFCNVRYLLADRFILIYLL